MASALETRVVWSKSFWSSLAVAFLEPLASTCFSLRTERRRRVQKALLALPADYRQVVVLRHFAELSYDDIAATLAIPATVVKSRLYTARQRLAAMLLGDMVR